jgi:hypothetical protein
MGLGLVEKFRGACSAERWVMRSTDRWSSCRRPGFGLLACGVPGLADFSLVSSKSLEDSIGEAMLLLVERPEYGRSYLAIKIARKVQIGIKYTSCPATIERIGSGWVGDDALAISLYCAMSVKGDLARGVSGWR